MGAVENLKEWSSRGVEIAFRAQEWKTCQLSTSGDADRVHHAFLYLMLSRISPCKQHCETQGRRKDQTVPFGKLHLHRAHVR